MRTCRSILAMILADFLCFMSVCAADPRFGRRRSQNCLPGPGADGPGVFAIVLDAGQSAAIPQLLDKPHKRRSQAEVSKINYPSGKSPAEKKSLPDQARDRPC